MKSVPVDRLTVRLQGDGNYEVEKLFYDESSEKIHINADQHFDNITSSIWNYCVGGYQVLDRWLKDHKKLELDDIKKLSSIVSSINETIHLQSSIDSLYPKVEEHLLELK
jgi:hypothetical protein